MIASVALVYFGPRQRPGHSVRLGTPRALTFARQDTWNDKGGLGTQSAIDPCESGDLLSTKNN